jgi:hypothetical protein
LPSNGILLILMQDDITLSVPSFEQKEIDATLAEGKNRCGYEIAIAHE